MFERLNDESRLFLSRGYLLEGQSPEERMMEISKTAEKILGIKGFADKFYDYLGKGYYSLSTPVRTNFGTERGMPISCHSVEMQDSVADIMHVNGELGMMTKLGAGVGTYFGNLRPRGARITNNGESSGAVHFMEMYDKTASVISQGSQRRGFTTPYLPVEHGDIDEFLEIGTEGHPIQRCTTAVTITNERMREMVEGDKDKRKIWSKILKRRTEVGYPYITFVGNMNEQRPDVYKDKGMFVKTSNICVTPETKILTDIGYIQIHELENKSVNVWNGERFTETVVRKTGENQEILKINTDNGCELECTPYHKFYIHSDTSRFSKKIVMKRANELLVGDKLIKSQYPIIDGEEELEYAYDNGFYSGDGCLTKNGQRIYLYHGKRDLIGEFSSIDKRYYQENQRRIYGHTQKLKDKFFVPSESYSLHSKLEWLAGLLDSDGCVTVNETSSQTVQLSSNNENFLMELQLLLQTMGCDSRISLAKEEGISMMPKNDGSGELGEYLTKKCNRILINGNSVYKLMSLGLNCRRLKLTLKEPSRECSQFVRISSIKNEGRISDTYCFTETGRGMGTFNGMLTGNCQEIALHTDKDHSFVCCLSSINLTHRDEIIETDAIETLVYFLDAIMQEFINKLEALRDSKDADDNTTFHFMRKAYNFALRERAIGVGVLGWHHYLQSKMIAIESDEASVINNHIRAVIKERTNKASEDMAKQYGEPSLMVGYGRRHSHLMAVAPTTSSAFIIGQTSQSIEPLMSNYYTKNLAKHTATIRNKYLEELLRSKRMNNRDVWDSIRDYDGSVQHLDFLTPEEKQVFKTFKEIDQSVIIQQAADRQKYIDQGQSLNIITTPSMTAKDISNLCIEAREKGIKGLYYAHSINAAQETVRSIKQAGDVNKVCYIGCTTCEA